MLKTGASNRNGTIITFYSYKGGVGRSMALANIGCLMALEDKKVLLIDWDLEAPGLEKYFVDKKNIRSSSIVRERPGIVDLLEGLTTKSGTHWQDCVSTFEFLGTGVDMITSGRRDTDYRKRVQSLDWSLLYDQYDVGAYMEEFRNEISRLYDYILIDSRTGITDIGDVCTVLLPDILVTLFVSNEQNIEGTIQIVERARKARSRLPVDRSRLAILPLPSRDESDAEYELATNWRARYATEFRKLLGEWLPKEVSAEDFFDRIYVPYVAIWSFGERLPVIESKRELRDPKSLGMSLQNTSRLLVNQLDWYALGDERNQSEVTAAQTQLRATVDELRNVEERYHLVASRVSTFRRRAILTGALGAIGAGFGGASLWFYLTNQLPTVALTIKSRVSLRSGFSAAAFTFDAKLLGRGDVDGSVEFIVIDNGIPIRSGPLNGHGGPVRSIDFSEGETRAVTGSADGSVRFWNTATRAEPYRAALIEGHDFFSVRSVAFSPDGARLLSGGEDGTLRLWDAETGEELRRIQAHDGASVRSVAFSPDGARLLSGGEDGTLRLWDAETRAELRRIEGHDGASVRSVAFSPDGTRLLSGSEDGTLQLWDAETGEELRRVEGHEGWVSSVAFSPDGTRLLSGSEDGTLRLWDAETGEELRRIQAQYGGVAFSPDGTRLLSIGGDGTLRLWNAETGEELRRIEGHGWVFSVAFSPDGTRLLSGGGEGTLRLWNAETGEELRRIEGHDGWVLSVAFSPDGTRLLSGGGDGTLRLWDAETGTPYNFAVVVFDAGVSSVTTSSRGGQVVCGTEDGEIVFVNPIARDPILQKIAGFSSMVTYLVHSPDNTLIASGSQAGQLEIRRASDGGLVNVLQGHSDSVNSISFSPDGLQLASGSSDGSVRLWAPSNNTPLLTIHTGTASIVSSIAYSPDAARIAVGHGSGALLVIDVAEQAVVGTLPASTSNLISAIVGISFSPDGRSISLVSAEGVVVIADLVAISV